MEGEVIGYKGTYERSKIPTSKGFLLKAEDIPGTWRRPIKKAQNTHYKHLDYK